MNLGDLILSTSSLQLKLASKSAVHSQSFLNVSMESSRNTTRATVRDIKEQVRGYCVLFIAFATDHESKTT